jgi:hypothetical protein
LCLNPVHENDWLHYFRLSGKVLINKGIKLIDSSEYIDPVIKDELQNMELNQDDCGWKAN